MHRPDPKRPNALPKGRTPARGQKRTHAEMAQERALTIAEGASAFDGIADRLKAASGAASPSEPSQAQKPCLPQNKAQASIAAYATARSGQDGLMASAHIQKGAELASDSPLRAVPDSWLRSFQDTPAEKSGGAKGIVVGYQRRSAAHDNESIARQHEGQVVYAEARGDVMEESFADRGISGATMIGREGLLKILDMARRGEIRKVLVDDVSRIARTMAILASFYEELTELGIEIHSIRKGGRLDLIDICIRGYMSAEERASIMRACLDGRMRMARDGRWPTGAFFGYEAVPGEPGVLRPHDVQKDIVLIMFKLYVAGTSPQLIADILNNQGIPSPANKRWRQNVISRMLRNVLYAGVIAFGKWRHYRNYRTGQTRKTLAPLAEWATSSAPDLQIVPEELFNAVQDMLASRTHSQPANRRTYLLSQRVLCPHCKSIMTPRTSVGGSTRISCVTAKVDRGTCCHVRLYPFDRIEVATLNLLRPLLDTGRNQHEFMATLETARSERRQSLASRKAEAERNVERLRRRFIDSLKAADQARALAVNPDHISHAMAEISQELETAEEMLARYRAEILRLPPLDDGHRETLLQALDDVIAEAPFRPSDDEGRHLFSSLRTLIDQVEILPRVGTRTIDLRVSVHLSPLVGRQGAGDDEVMILTGECEVDRFIHKQASSHVEELNQLIRNEYRFMSDREWEIVKKEIGRYSPRGTLSGVDKRKLINVIFCCLRIGLPFGQVSKDILGAGYPYLTNIARYLTYRGYFPNMVASLQILAPDFLEGVEIDFHSKCKWEAKRARDGLYWDASKLARRAKREEKRAGRPPPITAQAIILAMLLVQDELSTAMIDQAVKIEGWTLSASQKARAALLNAGLVGKNTKIWKLTERGRALALTGKAPQLQ